jgi:hypothetical protein
MPKGPMRTPVFATCPVHGTFAATGIIGLGPGARIRFGSDVTMNCPECGLSSQIIPGQYEGLLEERVRILFDGSFGPMILVQLARIAEKVKAGQISPETAKRQAQKLHPRAAKLFDIANWSDQAKATLYAAIIGAAAIVGAAKLSSGPTVVVNPPAVTVIHNDYKPSPPPSPQGHKARSSKTRPKK